MDLSRHKKQKRTRISYLTSKLEIACEYYRENGREDNQEACRMVTRYGVLLGRALLREQERIKNEKNLPL